MAIVVNTNVASLSIQRSLSAAGNSLSTSIERMSTGLKINSSRDDAAGLSIATKLNTQIRGSKVAQSNIQQGSSVLQTAEGDLNTISDNINRIRDLALQAANGINSSDSKNAIIKEVKARTDEIDRTANASKFNGVALLSSEADDITLQVGGNADADTNSITVENVFKTATSSALGLVTGSAQYADIDAAFASASTAASFVTDCDNALTEVTNRLADIGAYQNRLDSALSSLKVSEQNTTAAKSTIMDADIAQEASNYTKQSILQRASATLLAQANQMPSIALTLIG